MNTETQKVDVLAVMSDAAYYCLFECGNGAGHDAMQEARAAVAELIDASKEASGWVDQVSAAGCKALDRLDAALARVGGAA